MPAYDRRETVGMTGEQTGREPLGAPVVTVPADDTTVELGPASETVTITLSHRDLGLRRVGRLMRTVGMIGVLAGIGAIAIGLWLLYDLDAVFAQSLELTADSLVTVDSSLGVATESVQLVGAGVGDAEETSRGLQESLVEGSGLLRETATLTRTGVAESLESFERSLPALIQVAGTIDSTLRAVDQLPVGPEYDPDEPFDDSLRTLQRNLAGLPDELREQADAIDEAGDNLAAVGRQSVDIANAMRDVRMSLDDAGQVLAEYKTTTSQASALIEGTRADLERRLWILRALVVALGLIYCVGQILPIYLGGRMANMFKPDPPQRGASRIPQT